MAVTINADNGVVSGSAGLKESADSTGVLALQTNGTTAVSISTGQVVTLTNALAEASGGTGTTVGYNGFKNRIINGGMVIDQRNAGASVTVSSNQYTLDRFRSLASGGGAYSVVQSSTAPTGFSTSMLMTVTTTDTPLAATDYYVLRQSIEGYNIADLQWGTASAATVTLSFWVRSSVTGTFGGSLNNDSARAYPFTYTINAANTFEQKTITIAGDTSGTWNKTNGLGINVEISLGAGSSLLATAGAWTTPSTSPPTSATGSTNLMATNGATFYITGVQLEKGSTATSFDYRPFGTELVLCQRYYQQIGKSNNVSYQPYSVGVCTSTTNGSQLINLPIVMRATPTFTFNSPTNTFVGGSGVACTAVASDILSPVSILYNCTVAAGLVLNQGSRHYQNAANTSSLELSAEL
jgi:hypothetical protein